MKHCNTQDCDCMCNFMNVYGSKFCKFLCIVLKQLYQLLRRIYFFCICPQFIKYLLDFQERKTFQHIYIYFSFIEHFLHKGRNKMFPFEKLYRMKRCRKLFFQNVAIFFSLQDKGTKISDSSLMHVLYHQKQRILRATAILFSSVLSFFPNSVMSFASTNSVKICKSYFPPLLLEILQIL